MASTRYTIDSNFTYTTKEVTREEFLQFIRDYDCWGLIRFHDEDLEYHWSQQDGLCFTDKEFDWEHFDCTECIEPEFIAEHLGTEGPAIKEWNIIWSDDGEPIAVAEVE